MTKNKSKKSFLKTYAPILLFVFFSAAAAGLWYFAPKAFANTTSPATSPFTVTASVSPACTVTASNLTFPAYDPTSSTADPGSTTATVTCTLGTASAPNIDVTYATATYGKGSGGTTDPSMEGTSGGTSYFLSYQLYETAGGDGVAGTVFPSTNAAATALGLPQCISGTTTSNCFNLPGASTDYPVNIDGTIPINQPIPASVTYSDTVTLNVTF